MYLLDTNVVSELRKINKGRADRNVALWAQATPARLQFVSIITLLELERGVLMLERHDRAQAAELRLWLTRVEQSLAGRILPIDLRVARRCASLHVPDRRPDRDAFIAATALEHGFIMVTRDVADFSGMVRELVNPWDAPA